MCLFCSLELGNRCRYTEFNSELFAMGPVQFSWPFGAAEIWFVKPGFGSILLIFLGKTTTKHRVHSVFFSLDPGNLPNLIFAVGPDLVTLSLTKKKKKSRHGGSRWPRGQGSVLPSHLRLHPNGRLKTNHGLSLSNCYRKRGKNTVKNSDFEGQRL